MNKVGKPFKMEPLTRKARNIQFAASRALGIAIENLAWQQVDSKRIAKAAILVEAVGDKDHSTMRWVSTQNDPDWKIV